MLGLDQSCPTQAFYYYVDHHISYTSKVGDTAAPTSLFMIIYKAKQDSGGLPFSCPKRGQSLRWTEKERILSRRSMARWTAKDNLQQSSAQPTIYSDSNVIVTLNTPRSRWRQFISSIRWLVLDQWFLLALGLLILVSSQSQVSAINQAKKETVVTYLCVSIVFFITGCTLPSKILLDNYKRWKIHLFVQIQSFLMTSAVVYGVVSLCATNTNFMDPGLLVGLIFMVSTFSSLSFSLHLLLEITVDSVF